MGSLSVERFFWRERTTLFALCALGALARAVAVFFDGPLHPDEFFQYLEPAYMRLTGVGLQTWEFRDGIRSWVLPFYHGAWLAGLEAVGVHKGTALVRILQVQAALINSALVWVAYRAGASVTRKLTGAHVRAPWAGFEGGLYAAFLCASFPLLVLYAGHTLSESPSLLLLCFGLLQVCELSEEERVPTRASLKKAALAGFLLSCSACLRIANGPLVLIAPLFLLVTRRWRALSWLVIAALVPALVFGLVDLLTWGEFAHSYVEYLRFNFVEGKAARFGVAPATYYLEELWKRAPYTGPALLALACLGVRRSYLFLLPLLLGVAYLSTQPHKEERFVVFVWPLLFIAVGALLAALRARLGQAAGSRRALSFVVPLALLLAAPIEGAFHLEGRSWLRPAMFRAEARAAEDESLTGMMVEYPIGGGGGLWLGVDAPHFQFSQEVLPNPLITHVIVGHGSWQQGLAEANGFTLLQREEEFVVLRRSPAQR